jgi:tetratricopeptide (TPR) repeat protein
VLERLVRSRVDRLSPAAQEAIRAASVLGEKFTAALLAATLGAATLGAEAAGAATLGAEAAGAEAAGAEAAGAATLGSEAAGAEAAGLAPVLDELTESDLVHRDPPGSAGRVFLFRHALIQEATYLGLLRAERRDLHARAAAAVEAASGDRLPEVAALLGRHYAAAEDSASAVRFLEMAGDHATDAFANDEAVASFRAALAIPAADAVRLNAKQANVLWRVGRREEARDAYREALRLAGSHDPLLRAHLYTRLGRLELADLRYEPAAAALHAAEALLGDDPGGGDDATVDQWLEILVDGRADMHVMRFEPDLALAALEAARPLLEARGTPARWTVFNRIFTLQRLLRNRFRVDDEDIAALRSSVEAAEHTGEEKDLGYAVDFLGWALWLRGDLRAARENLEKAHAMAERIGETNLHAVSVLALTLTALRQHDTEQVRALLPHAMAVAWAADTGSRIAGPMACQAWLAWQDGDPDEVIRLAAEIGSLDLTTIGSGARYRWVYLFPLIAARLHTGAVADAVAAARQIIDPAQQLLADEVMAALAAACASWQAAEPEAARARLAAALTLAGDHGFF